MTTIRRALTDAGLRNLKPPLDGPTVTIADTISPLMVKVRPSGHASFFVHGRFGGAKNPASRTIGSVKAVKLADARETARKWTQLAKAKDDPARIERQRRDAEANAVMFGQAWTDYCAMRLAKQRRGHRVKLEIEKETRGWADRPLASITRADVAKVVDQVLRRGAPYQARNTLGGLSTFFGWAVDRVSYGLEHSPCDRLRKANLIGPTPARQRVLSDHEIFACWRAAGRLGYPFGPMVRLILLTGARRGEVADAQWNELHPDLVRIIRQRKPGERVDWSAVPDAVKVWTIPEERFKSKAQHVIPLSDAACEILAELPYFRGSYVFTTTSGQRPVSGFGRPKERLDDAMLRSLKALDRARGEDPRAVRLKPFVFHDLRRTFRTRLSALRVPDHIAELAIGHARSGIQGVYDRHSYEAEVGEAMTAWAAKLASIVNPPTPDTVRYLSAYRA